MRQMARSGHDREDGWTFYCKTNIEGSNEEEQLDVYQRQVDWSLSKQLRTVVKVDDLSPEEIFDSIVTEWGQRDNDLHKMANRVQGKVSSDARSESLPCLFKHK